jgi:hypothetical protein
MMREQAATAFGARLQSLRRTADDGWANYDRYMKACDGKVTMTRPVTPPGVPLDSIVLGGTDALVAQGRLLPPGTGSGPSGISNETTPQCRLLWDDTTKASSMVERELNDIQETARRRGIYRGIVRDLLTKYGFK